MNNFTVSDVTLDRLPDRAEELASLFKQHGVLHLRKLLPGDETFEPLVREIKALTVMLLDKAGYPASSERSLEQLIRDLKLRAPTYPAYLYDMLTRPMKLLSSNLLKQHPGLTALAQHIFGADALVASLFQSDNFLMVPPSAESDRFVLPIHQDFPYQMQAAQQITYWLSLSEWAWAA
jgi:hypothetical protein